MSDGIQFDINATWKGDAAVAAASSSMSKLESTGKSLSQGYVSAGGILDRWTAAQYAAARGGSLLTDKAIALSTAVNNGSMSLRQATKEYAAYERQIKQSVTSQMTLGERIGVVNSRLESGVKTLGKYAAAGLAVGFAAKEIYKFGEAGAQIDYTRQKFDRLALSVGATGNTFLQDLRSATRGTVSDFELLRQGSDLLQLGLAKDANEATRLSKVMTALGMDTGELTLALANQSKRRLDQLGLSLSKFNEIEAKLKDKGLSKEDAFKEAFMQTAEQTISITGNRADSEYGNYLRFQAQLANTIDAAKVGTGNLLDPLVSDAGNIMQAMSAVRNQDMAWNGNIFDIIFGEDAPLRQGKASDYSDLWSGGGRNRTMAGRGVVESGITGLSAMQSYTAMAYAYRNKEGPGLQQSGDGGDGSTLDYSMLLDGTLRITNQNEKYKETVDGLNEKLLEQTSKLETLRKGTKAYTDQLDKINDTKDSLTEVQQAQVGAGSGAVLSNLSGMGADPQIMLEYARASGMVTDEAYAAQAAYMKIADTLNTGKNSATEAALATKAISSGLGNLNGKAFTTYVDVIVRWIGSVGVFGGAGGLNRTNNAAVQNCFAPDTLILMADETEKQIKDIKVGDWVKSYNTANGVLIDACVEKVFYHPVVDAGDFYLLINNRVRVTPEHPLYVINEGWLDAGKIKHGDQLIAPNGVEVVLSVERIYRKIETYNLHIADENHNYFAGGLLAHNKATGGWVSAPGDGTVDTILVPLANEEFVVNAKAARKNKKLLEEINNNSLVFGGGLATGGFVKPYVSGSRYITPTQTRQKKSGNSGSSSSTDFSGDTGGSLSAIEGIVPAISSDISANISISIAQSVADAVTRVVGSSPQFAAIAESVDLFREMNDNLQALLSKTASAGEIGRAVNGNAARRAV